MTSEPPELVVVGSGRSGTTIVLEAIAAAVPGVQGVPRLAGRMPRLTAAAVLMDRLGVGPHAWRRPSAETTGLFTEAGITQERQASLGGRVMRLDDLASQDALRLQRRVGTVRRLSASRTVVFKNTASCGRIPLLDALFPRAVFVHVLRRPSAVVTSLLKTDFWQDMTLWWDGRTTADYARQEGLPPEQVAARHWGRQVDTADRSLARLDPTRHTTIRYEAFTRDPMSALAVLGVFGFDPPRVDVLSEMGIRPEPDTRTPSDDVMAAVQEECLEIVERLGLEP